MNIARLLRPGASALLLLACVLSLPSAGIAETTEVTTETTTTIIRVRGADLLAHVRRGAAVIIVELKSLQSAGKLGKRAVFLLQAANQFRLDIAELQAATAVGKRRGVDISKATRDALVSYGRLRATYQMLDYRSARLDEAIRSISVAWASYASYMIVVKPSDKLRATQVQIDRVRTTIRRVHDRARAARAKVAKNKLFARQFDRVIASLRPYYGAQLTWATYQAALAELALVNGSYDALAVLADRYDRDLAAIVAQQIAINDAQVWSESFSAFYSSFEWKDFDAGLEVPADLALDPTVVPLAIASGPDDKIDVDVAAIETALDAKPDDALPADDPDVADAKGVDLDKTFDCAATGCEDLPAVNPNAASVESATSSDDDDGAAPKDEPAGKTAQPDSGTDQNATPDDDNSESPGTTDDNADTPDSNDDNADAPPAGRDDAAPSDDSGGGGTDDGGGSDNSGGGSDDSGGSTDDGGGGGSDDSGGGSDDGGGSE